MPAQNHLLDRAIAFSQKGEKETARRILLGILKENETYQEAWIQYAKTFESPRDQAAALQKALVRCPEMNEVQRAYQAIQRQADNRGTLTWGSTTPAYATAAPAPRATASRAPAPRADARPQRQPQQRPAQAPLGFILLTLLAVVGLIASSFYYSGRLTLQSGQVSQLQTEKHALLDNNQKTVKELDEARAAILAGQEQYNALAGEFRTLQDQNQALTRKHQTLSDSFQTLQKQQQALTKDYQALQQQHQTLTNDYQTLRQQHQELTDSYTGLNQQYRDLQGQYDQLNYGYNDMLTKAVLPPYITIAQREVYMAFYRRDNSVARWSVPFALLEDQITKGERARSNLWLPANALTLKDKEGTIYHVADITPFVDPAPFANFIPEIYRQAPSDEAFLDEVWFMVTQLTIYTTDGSDETPRFPMETLLARGGDCEDSSILFASMIKAAPVPWKVTFIAMNRNRPTELVEPNHVIVKVETGSATHYIETADTDTMEPYQQGVAGWLLEIE